MFATTVVLMLLASPVGEIVETTRGLELDLRVIEAFEHGPVILDVTLTNRGKKPLMLHRGLGQNDSRIALPAAWHAWSPPPVFPPTTSLSPTLAAGQSLTERHRLHLDYLSRFPAGKYEVEVSWVVHSPPKSGVGECPVIAIPTKKFPVTTSPATPANRYALACRLEAEFSTLRPFAAGTGDDPLAVLCEKLSNTPHKELIPLALQMMKRVELDPKNWELRRLLVDFLFRADPKVAHQLFVDRLLANAPDQYALDAFSIWRWAVYDFRDPVEAYFERLYEQPRQEMSPDPDSYWFHPATWGDLFPAEEVWSFLIWANFLAPRVLPGDELKRLGKAKDFAIRAYTYSVFGHRLEAAWCDEFLKEARRYAQAKPDPKDADPKQSLIHSFLKGEDPDEPRARKLLDIFAAGAKDNPLTKVAREELAEYEKRTQERKP